MILPFALGVGLFGRAVMFVFEFIADGKAVVKSLGRIELDDSCLLTTGRRCAPCVGSAFFGSSLLLVRRWPGRCNLCVGFGTFTAFASAGGGGSSCN